MQVSSISHHKIDQWHGRYSSISPHAVPPGGSRTQDNIESLDAGRLSARKGIQPHVGPSPPGADDILSLYSYIRPLGNALITVDTSGDIKARIGSGSEIDLATGVKISRPWQFERSRRGHLIGANGLERGILWNGTSAAAFELGVDAPTAAPSVSTPSGGNATAGDYTCAFRFVDGDQPLGVPSSISPEVIVTAAEGDKFGWTGLAALASTQARVTHVELWRSPSDAPNVLYKIAQIGSGGNVLAIISDAGFASIGVHLNHDLIEGAKIVVTGCDVGAYNTTHTITAIYDSSVVTDITYTSNGLGGDWAAEGLDSSYDSDSDSELQAAAVADSEALLVVILPNGDVSARRFTPPPSHAIAVKSFQDRFFYLGTADYTAGTVAINTGSPGIVGTETAWTEGMVGRFIHIDGELEPYEITGYTTPTALVVGRIMGDTASSLAYAITPPPSDRNKIYYSEPDEPESVPVTNVITVQENTDDDDSIVGAMPFGSVLYVLKERHVYTCSFARQPKIDADVRLLTHRGCVNANCYTFHEGTAYLLDQLGAYKMSTGGAVEPISEPIQDLWRDGTIDWSKKEWFHVDADPVYGLVYFFVAFTGDSGTRPKRALVYNTRGKQWWTVDLGIEIGGSARAVVSGKVRLILGGEGRVVYLANEGETDVVTAETRSTATASTSTTLTDSTASFTDAMIGAPIAIVSGTGKGQLRRITARTSTQLTVDPAWATDPDATSTYLVGAIKWSIKSGLFEFAEDVAGHDRSFSFSFEPTIGASTLDLKRYLNHDSSPLTQPLKQHKGVGGLLTRAKGDDHAVVELQAIQRGSDPVAGWANDSYGGKGQTRMQGQRWAAFEMLGFKGDDPILVYGATVHGVT
jgi:hypothetical protein